MKIASLIGRYLLGLIFFVFGLNGFLHFIPMGPIPNPVAMQYFTVMVASHYMAIVSSLQILTGLLLLIGRYVPLALTVSGAIIVNILIFHVLMNPQGLPLAIVVTILWILAARGVWSAFTPLFQQKASA
jgi:uncharacterized membrane protein YphA (DoxX/SURF4 family)